MIIVMSKQFSQPRLVQYTKYKEKMCWVPADWGQESQASSWVEAWNSACLSRCPRGEKPLVELSLEPGVFFRTMHGKTAPSC